MAFIRVKIIAGKRYFYLVRNERIEGKVRQKVVKYIGTSKDLILYYKNADKKTNR
jgi:hypothetical protein